MARFVGQAVDQRFNRRRFERRQLGHALPRKPFRQRRSGSDAGGAASGEVAGVGNHALVDARAEPQNVSASRVRNLDGQRRRLQFTRIFRVPKVFEKLFAEHG